uniref:Uncharacterized protein n=1 Tax=Arundo donax TaxID=35708 RepID=A0A0A9D2Q5_ARUDO
MPPPPRRQTVWCHLASTASWLGVPSTVSSTQSIQHFSLPKREEGRARLQHLILMRRLSAVPSTC